LNLQTTKQSATEWTSSDDGHLPAQALCQLQRQVNASDPLDKILGSQ